MDSVTFSAIIGISMLFTLSLFQIALIAGAPIARFAWGGSHDILPLKLRVSSGISILLYGLFFVFIVSKAGLIPIISHQVILDVGMWVITGYFILGVVLNALSRSKPERSVMTPVALCLAISYLVVAIS